MKLVSRRGQSTGEYAILFAIVLGAVIGMQNYIRNRIAGRLQLEADEYAKIDDDTSVTPVALERQSDSLSASSASMSSAKQGSFRSDSQSGQKQTNPLGAGL